MIFEEPEGRRAQAAHEFLSAGGPVSFRGLGLQIERSGVLACRVYSAWRAGNLTAERAAGEFSAGQAILDELLAGSPAFAALAAARPMRWSLLDDHGTGAVEVARLEGGRVVWSLPERNRS